MSESWWKQQDETIFTDHWYGRIAVDFLPAGTSNTAGCANVYGRADRDRDRDRASNRTAHPPANVFPDP
jgi:hypothetical protein